MFSIILAVLLILLGIGLLIAAWFVATTASLGGWRVTAIVFVALGLWAILANIGTPIRAIWGFFFPTTSDASTASSPIAPDATLVVIEEEESGPIFAGDPRSACPTVAYTGKDGQPLIFALDPYGDYRQSGVVCEYEIVGQVGGSVVSIPNGMGALIADWATTCPTGPICEGTWVATEDFRLPAGWLAHVYIYTSVDSAIARFLGNQTTGEGSFACEYLLSNTGHTVENIRVPEFWSTWEETDGSIFGHAKICPSAPAQ